MNGIVRATLETKFIQFAVDYLNSTRLYVAGAWWEHGPDGWSPLPHDRNLLKVLKQAGAAFADEDPTDVDRALWVMELPMEHRLLPLCRRLRVPLASDLLPHR